MNPNNQNMPTKTPIVHHRMRTFFASILGTIALLLIFTSILTVWLNRSLTDTSTYVSTVAPLASDQDIQTFVSQKATNEIVKNLPIQDAASKLLPGQDTNQAVDALRQLVKPIVSQSVTQVVTSKQFASIWRDTNASVHAQLIAQLNSTDLKNQINLDMTPVINGVLAQLKTTQLGNLVDQVKLNANAGVITIKDDKVSKLRDGYHQFKRNTIVMVAAAVVFAALAIIVSVHHAKTFRRVLFATGIGTLFLALVFWLAGRINFVGNGDVTEQNAIMAIARILLHNLQLACTVIGLACIIVAITYKLIEARAQARTKQQLSAAKGPLKRPSSSVGIGSSTSNRTKNTTKV